MKKEHHNAVTNNKDGRYTDSKEVLYTHKKDTIKTYIKGEIFTDNKQNHTPYLYFNANNSNETQRNNSKETT